MERTAGYAREGYLHEDYHYFHLRDTAGQERDFHFHDFDKAVLLLSGRVDYAVESAVYTLKPWDVLLVRRHAIHKALIDRNEPYERVILYLDRRFFQRSPSGGGLLDCFDRAAQAGQYLFTPDEARRQKLAAALAAYEEVRDDDGPGAQTLRDACILQLLVHIDRLSRSGTPAPERGEGAGDPKIDKVLTYINEHLTEPLPVDALAERAYLSRYHFMRLFKAQTGLTAHAYVRQKRLLNAARLIREGVPAAQAAAESGFNDYSAFHRAFRSCFGISPGELRQ